MILVTLENPFSIEPNIESVKLCVNEKSALTHCVSRLSCSVKACEGCGEADLFK